MANDDPLAPHRGAPQRDEEEAIVAELRAAGLKATPQRRAIIRTLLGDETHPTAQDIFERLSREHPGMAFATVYNTLGALQSIARVRSLAVGGATRFDPKVEHHDHVQCERCGAIRDVPAAPTGTLPEIDGFELLHVERLYRGVCAACRDDDGAPRERPEDAR